MSGKALLVDDNKYRLPRRDFRSCVNVKVMERNVWQEYIHIIISVPPSIQSHY